VVEQVLITKKSELILQEGESLLLAGTPITELRWVLMGWSVFYAVITIIGLPFLPFIPWAVGQRMQWHRWWLTDRRIVIQTGLIGWQIRSIPLNRISDISLESSWLDRIFGVQNLTIRDMTGVTDSTSYPRMLGVPNAHAVQQALLSEVSKSSVSDESSHLDRIVDLLESMTQLQLQKG
jgi:uncharacterized membrane protein YdbT with pleckstrin-like domain